MPVSEIGDPRLKALFGANDPRDTGVRPTVRLAHKGLPPAAFAIGIAFLGLLLFLALNARRTSQEQPTARVRTADSPAAAWEVPPPLYIPPAEAPTVVPTVPEQKPEPKGLAAPAPEPRPAPIVAYAPQPVPQMMPLPAPAPAPPPRVSSGSPLVIDTGNGQTGAAGSPATGVSPILPPTQSMARVRASVLANRAVTVPQGTLIQAVLETAFDSTKPGFARAIVSRDVRGFDGKNILIPRGSRLVGEYQSAVTQGQNRAIIIWTRLIRPDGMTIAMDSPAVDTVGRGGVAANVNTHFFARLGDALLQTTVGLGSALAMRSVDSPVVVVPGASAVGQAVAPTTNAYVPTLTVPAGKSISVFVAHDLDFSAAGLGR